MALALQVPGVYVEPRPRRAEPFEVRTDVAGFVGLDPRVRPAPGPRLLGGGAGHRLAVETTAFHVALGGRRRPQPGGTLVLSQSAGSPLLAPGQAAVFAVVAVADGAERARLAPVAGATAPVRSEVPPSDADVGAALGVPFVRVADVWARRVGGELRLTAVPAQRLTRCDDLRDYLLAFGAPPEDGTLLGAAVAAFFANGGRRCFVTTLRRPDLDDTEQLQRVLEELVGDPGASEEAATGVERLLLVEQVTVLDVPDLHARRVDVHAETVPLPPSDTDACFHRCAPLLPPGVATSTSRDVASEPVFDAAGPGSDVFRTQRALVQRLVREHWRALLLLSVPEQLDPATGTWGPPSASQAEAWRDLFDALPKSAGFAEPEQLSCAALYWPWLLVQERVDAPVATLPPTASVAGVIARRDLARGPQVAPANETLKAVVGLAPVPSHEANARVYAPGPDASGRTRASANVLRAFPGLGVQVWGARTLSTDPWLRFLPVRRALTAVELRARAALAALTFEPNTPLLWLQVTQALLAILMPLYEAGALRGASPEEAFYVRCDASVNPPEAVREGRLFVEVGVAVAAPAEFIVFRIGRREGVVEVLE